MKGVIMTILGSFLTIMAAAQRPPITPAWAFGHIVWEDSLNNTTGVNRLVDGYASHQIPVDGIIIDSPWSTAYNDFNWDTERYANPNDMLASLCHKGIRPILWLTGNVNRRGKDTRLQKCAQYDHAVSHKYGVNNSKPYKWWKGEGIHIDFTNPEATEWWYTQLDKVFNENVYGWKVDQGEVWLGKKVKTSIGKMTNEDFRHYYYDAMFDYTVSRKKDGIIIARPFSWQGGMEASIEKANMCWCGDFEGDWAGLKKQIDNIYRSSQLGYGAVATEIGGFFNKNSNARQFIRYAQFGATTACMINGGENGAFSSHIPWYWGKEIADSYRRCVTIHRALAPYMFSTVVDAHLNGGSLLWNTNLQTYSHQIGRDVFTKAITSDSSEVTVYMPSEGTWMDVWTGKRYKSSEKVVHDYDVSQFPLFVRCGAIIPLSGDAIGLNTGYNCPVFFVLPGVNTERKFHLPLSEATDYSDVTVSVSEDSGEISLFGKVFSHYILAVKTSKPKKVIGSVSWEYREHLGVLLIHVDGHEAHVKIEN